MAELKINRLTNANLYIDGVGYLGQAKEIELPSLEHVMEEHSGLGMVGKIETFSGIDKMEAKITWTSVYPDALKTLANPNNIRNIQIRGSIDNFQGVGIVSRQSYICYISGLAKSVGLGNFAQHSNNEVETMLAVYKVKMEVAGVSVFEFDAMNNIWKVNGEDMLADYRSNIGG